MTTDDSTICESTRDRLTSHPLIPREVANASVSSLMAEKSSVVSSTLVAAADAKSCACCLSESTLANSKLPNQITTRTGKHTAASTAAAARLFLNLVLTYSLSCSGSICALVRFVFDESNPLLKLMTRIQLRANFCFEKLKLSCGILAPSDVKKTH